MAQTSKKLYKAVAEEIAVDRRNSKGDEVWHQRMLMLITNIEEGLADIFAADNPNFGRERFYAACHEEGV